MAASIGIELIAAERQRQIEVEGYTSDRDDAQVYAQLARAAICYVADAIEHDRIPWNIWPWRISEWKPKDPISDLVRAGALIAAEIDRLQRVAEAAMED